MTRQKVSWLFGGNEVMKGALTKFALSLGRFSFEVSGSFSVLLGVSFEGSGYLRC